LPVFAIGRLAFPRRRRTDPPRCTTRQTTANFAGYPHATPYCGHIPRPILG